MDKKARNILFKTYWDSSGWLSEHKTDPEDFVYARSQGVMFDPVNVTHDDCLQTILAIAKRMPPTKASHAFLSSLSTKDSTGGQASPHTISPVK